MKELCIKAGTKKEILEYFNEKLSPDLNIERLTILDVGRCYVKIPVEKQINECIANGYPLISVRYYTIEWKEHLTVKFAHEQIIIEDFADLRLQMEMNKLDDPSYRNNYMEKLKMIIMMDIEAEDRWTRIVDAMNEFKGQNIKFV